MDTKGQHLILDVYDCRPELLNDDQQLKEMMIRAIDQLGMEIISSFFHSFSPQGVTGILVLSTSHFSIHTWPEHGYAAFDLYTCGEQSLWPAFKEIIDIIGAKRALLYELARGNEHEHSPIMKKFVFGSSQSKHEQGEQPQHQSHSRQLFHLQDGRGNNWDMKQLKEIISGNHEVLYQGSSPYQDILLVKANDLRLYLNQELQFSSLDERHYHEALVFPVMETATNHERVLILGGGDGLALREVLKYPDVKHVDLVDIDPLMIQLSKTHPALLEQNNDAFFDKRVHVHLNDAKEYLQQNIKAYDVIIIDFPDPVDSVISSLYTKELFMGVANLLTEDGALVCQSNSSEDAPKTYWSIRKTLKSTGLDTLSYNVTVPSFGLWGFHLGAHKQLTKPLPDVSVLHQAIPANLKSLFKIPKDIKSERKKAIINSEEDLKLHEIYQKEIREWDYF